MIIATGENATQSDIRAALQEFIDLLDELNLELQKCGIVGGVELLSKWKKHGKVSSAAKISLNGIDVTNAVIVAAQEWKNGRYALSAVSVGKAVFKAEPELVDKTVGLFLKGLMKGLSDTAFKFDFGMCKSDLSQIWASMNF